jgi:ribose transport system ATP-binding protein
MVPEERKSEGLILNHSIKMNLSLMVLKRLTKGIVLDFARESKIVDQYKDALSIKMRSTNQSAYTLSGGNQQKIVISKCLASDPKLIILDEPTRGVDVGTKKEVYSIVNKYADEGLGVILISSELDEVIGLSDRIVVLAEGKITAEFEREDFDKQEILYYASLSDSRGVVENP